MSRESRLYILQCLAIALLTLIIYWQVQDFKFVYYDDDVYVTEKPHVMAGLTCEGVTWAFTATEAGFWHPLTWLSLMLDVELFGINTGGYHWTNVILHLCTSLLFFALLRLATGQGGRSFLCACLFAVHPLHVESVAWIAARKDLLSTLFGFASLLVYVHYARSPNWKRYAVVVLFFILALMAKPMVVTFPLLMLLLDFWPLRRVNRNAGLLKLFGEKVPLLALSLAAGILVVYTEQKGGALTPLSDLTFPTRLANALVSYVKYMVMTLWPTNLAFFYPYPHRIPPIHAIAAGLLLIVITAASLWMGTRRPYLTVGWLWYVITLLPVCGIIQVGPHALADRYTYVTINGLFIMAVWGSFEWAERHSFRRVVVSGLWAATIIILSYVAWVQVGYWRNTTTLMERALKVTQGNYIAHTNLGVFHITEGRYREGIRELEQAAKIKPNFSIIYYNMGYAWNLLKEPERAIPTLEKALAMGFKPNETLLQLGQAYELLGNWPQAIAMYEKILVRDSHHVAGHHALARALEASQQWEEAKKVWARLLAFAPGDLLARKRLICLYLTDRDYPSAIRIGEEGMAKKSADPELYRLLSLAYRASGNTARADYYLTRSES